MSFTTEVKNELCTALPPRKQSKIILYGFLYALKDGGVNGFYTESKQVCDFITEISGKSRIKVSNKRKNGAWGYLLQFAKLGGIIREADVFSPVISREIVDGNDIATGLFLRGVFLASGIVADPNKEYHLELSVSNDEKCDRVQKLITETGMTVKKSARKGQPFLYTKESEGISDFLTFIGAMINSMEIMNVKIYKDVRNNVNRTVNCEAANIAKTVTASQKQVADIEYIDKTKGLDFLDEDLRAVAILRRDNIDMSLRELGEALEPPISRSGVNHRLKRLGDIAESLKNSK